MWATAAPARAASIAAAAMASGVTGTRSLAPVVSPAPVTAHVTKTSWFTPCSSRGDHGTAILSGPSSALGETSSRRRSQCRPMRRLPSTATLPFSSASGSVAMALCFIEPQDAIRVIAESVGREARRQLLGEIVRAWVDEIPEQELASHYAKAVADLDEHDLSMLAAWHASLEVGHPIANREFLVNVFPSLGENRREALKIAAGFRGEEAFDAGVAEEEALDTVLPYLSRERSIELATECLDLYLWDRLGCDN